MKVRELIEKLQQVDPEKIVAYQKNHHGGGFTLYSIAIQFEGHIGYRGPVLHAVNLLEGECEKSPTASVPDKEGEG